MAKERFVVAESDTKGVMYVVDLQDRYFATFKNDREGNRADLFCRTCNRISERAQDSTVEWRQLDTDMTFPSVERFWQSADETLELYEHQKWVALPRYVKLRCKDLEFLRTATLAFAVSGMERKQPSQTVEDVFDESLWLAKRLCVALEQEGHWRPGDLKPDFLCDTQRDQHKQDKS